MAVCYTLLSQNSLDFCFAAGVGDQPRQPKSARKNFALMTLLVSLPCGFLVAMLINESSYQLEHTYFTKAAETMARMSIVHSVHLVLAALSFLYSLFSVSESPVQGNDSFWTGLKAIGGSDVSWHAILGFTFVFFILFYSLPQYEYLVNTFPFVFELSRLFEMYFMIGAAWACASFNMFFGRVVNRVNSTPMWVSFAVYVASQAVMLGFVEGIVSTPLTSFCAFASGFSLMHGIIASLLTAVDYALERPRIEAKALMALTTSVACAFAAILVLVGDLAYYSNRDVTYWAYILNSAFPGLGFLISAILVHTFEARMEKARQQQN